MKREIHQLYKNVRPNLGYYFISSLEERGKLLGLITQNIDGLHSLAGLPDEKIVELHGTDRKVVCLSCEKTFDPEEVMKNLVGGFKSPRCDECGGLLKSATVSFGQAMPVQPMRRAQLLTEGANLFVVFGSSLQVQPAASFPVLAKRNGAFLAIINREPTPLDEIADFQYQGPIGEFCTQLRSLIADS